MVDEYLISQHTEFKNVFLVTDAALVKCGVVNKVTKLLDEAKINYTIYSDVKPNLTIANLMNGLKECKYFNTDLILTIGGGSATQQRVYLY